MIAWPPGVVVIQGMAQGAIGVGGIRRRSAKTTTDDACLRLAAQILRVVDGDLAKTAGLIHSAQCGA